MKRIFTLLLATALTFGANAQLLVDDFNYTGLLTDNGWSVTGTNVNDPISTTSGLTFAGYPGSGVGNAANVVGANQDVNKGFTAQSGLGSVVWMSALINVTEASAQTGGYFLHLGDRSDTDPTSFTSFSARLWAKTDNTGVVNFGVSNTSTAQYGTTPFQTNTTYLVIIKYSIALAVPDTARLWVIPSGVPVDEASLGTPEVVNTTNGQDNIDAVGLRQASGIPDVIVDGLRIAPDYNSVVLPLHLTSFKGALANGVATLTWTTANESDVRAFRVEKSTDGRTYNEFAVVNAGNRASNSYSAIDNNVAAGANYYRLNMIDKDGSSRISHVVVLNNRALKAQVFPNPVVNTLTVSHDRAEKGAVIRILSVDGKQVKQLNVQAGTTQSSFAVSELVKGNYLLVFESNGAKATSLFSKQ